MSYKSKIMKKSQWGFEGKLDSVNDAVEHPIHEEPLKLIAGEKVLVGDITYTLGHKIHEDGDNEVYEAWFSSPDIPQGTMLHYTQVYKPRQDHWELEKDVTAKTNYRTKIAQLAQKTYTPEQQANFRKQRYEHIVEKIKNYFENHDKNGMRDYQVMDMVRFLSNAFLEQFPKAE